MYKIIGLLFVAIFHTKCEQIFEGAVNEQSQRKIKSTKAVVLLGMPTLKMARVGIYSIKTKSTLFLFSSRISNKPLFGGSGTLSPYSHQIPSKTF